MIQHHFHFNLKTTQNLIYRKGFSSIPFASRITDATITPPIIQIPAKTKPSFLSIIHQKLILLFV